MVTHRAGCGADDVAGQPPDHAWPLPPQGGPSIDWYRDRHVARCRRRYRVRQLRCLRQVWTRRACSCGVASEHYPTSPKPASWWMQAHGMKSHNVVCATSCRQQLRRMRPQPHERPGSTRSPAMPADAERAAQTEPAHLQHAHDGLHVLALSPAPARLSPSKSDAVGGRHHSQPRCQACRHRRPRVARCMAGVEATRQLAQPTVRWTRLPL